MPIARARARIVTRVAASLRTGPRLHGTRCAVDSCRSRREPGVEGQGVERHEGACSLDARRGMKWNMKWNSGSPATDWSEGSDAHHPVRFRGAVRALCPVEAGSEGSKANVEMTAIASLGADHLDWSVRVRSDRESGSRRAARRWSQPTRDLHDQTRTSWPHGSWAVAGADPLISWRHPGGRRYSRGRLPGPPSPGPLHEPDRPRRSHS